MTPSPHRAIARLQRALAHARSRRARTDIEAALADVRLLAQRQDEDDAAFERWAGEQEAAWIAEGQHAQ